MSVLSKLTKLIPIKVARNATVLVPTTLAVAVAGKKLPELFSSNEDVEMVDSFEKNAKEQSKVEDSDTWVKSKKEIKQTNKTIRKSYGVSFWKNLGYVVSSVFVDKDILSVIQDEIEKDSRNTSKLDQEKKELLLAYLSERLDNLAGKSRSNEAKIEVYKLYAREYMRSIIGDIDENSSVEEIEEAYKNAEQAYALQITHVSKEDKELFNLVMPAVISEMKAEHRGKYAESFAQTAVSRKDEISKIDGLLDCARENVTKKDKTGKAPDRNTAIKYWGVIDLRSNEYIDKKKEQMVKNYSCTFDVQKGQEAKRKKERGESLTKEEQEAYTEYENLIVAPHASRLMNLPGNENLSPQYRKQALGEMNAKLKEQGVQKDVIEAVGEYLESSPDSALILERIVKATGKDLAQILDEVTDGEYSRICSNSGEKGYANSLTKGNATTENDKKGSEQNGSIDGNAQDTDASGDIDGNTPSNTTARTYNSNINQFVTSVLHSAINGGEAVPGKPANNNSNVPSSDSKDTKAFTRYTGRPAVLNSFKECKEYITNTEAAKLIITGKVKLMNRAGEGFVLEQYKIMSTEDQGSMLADASDRWYEKLKSHTRNKYASIASCLNSGIKGKNFDRTKDMRRTLEEKNKKLKT